jgi:hypothetical protein
VKWRKNERNGKEVLQKLDTHGNRESEERRAGAA